MVSWSIWGARAFQLFKKAGSRWIDDNAQGLGAELAYYSLFSIGPLVLIAVSIAGLFFDSKIVVDELLNQIRGLIGNDSAEAISSLMSGVQRPKAAGIAGIAGVVMLLIGGTGVVITLKDSLNHIWRVKPKPGHGILIFARKYLLSLAAVMSLGFLLMVSLVASTALAAVGKYFSPIAASQALLHAANFLLSFVLLTLLIAGIFKFLPDVKLRLRDVTPGAAVTTILFLGGKSLIGLYLGTQSFASTYGAASSFVVVMVWVYYTAQIIYFGAELTEVYCRERNPNLTPADEAEFTSEPLRT